MESQPDTIFTIIITTIYKEEVMQKCNKRANVEMSLDDGKGTFSMRGKKRICRRGSQAKSSDYIRKSKGLE